MRLDKFICQSSELSRTDAKKHLHRGQVKVNGIVNKNSAYQVSDIDLITLDNQALNIIGLRYIMLNKPQDTICSTIDELYPSVLNFINVEKQADLHIAGRLDADTTGLVLITDDGKWSHGVTAPRRDCEKVYRVGLAIHITQDMITQLEQGIELHGEVGITKPAKVTVLSAQEILLTISEGKYHQVKRMCAAVGNKVVTLHRQQIGEIKLDGNLALGEWRYLTAAEIASIV